MNPSAGKHPGPRAPTLRSAAGQAATASATVRQVLACQDCGQGGSGGLCEACGCRREATALTTQIEALTARTEMLVAARSADVSSPDAVAAICARVRTAIDRKVAADWSEFLEITDPAELAADPARAELAAAHTAYGTVQQIAVQAERTALAAFGRTGEAEAEADRAYRTEQGRRWFRRNPTGEAAVVAATKASATARDRTAQHLLAVRLEQLREQVGVQAGTAAAAVRWMDRLPGLAGRALDGETTVAVTA